MRPTYKPKRSDDCPTRECQHDLQNVGDEDYGDGLATILYHCGHCGKTHEVDENDLEYIFDEDEKE